MSILEALYPLAQVSRFQRRYDDDFVDRLNHRFSTLTFVALSVIVTAYQNVLDPISCWAPAQFTHEWIEYTNSICWISNTYYVPADKLLPAPSEPRERQIAYYQWVPVVIFIQALFFFAPNVVWKALHSRSGVHINKIVSAVSGVEHGSPDVRDKTIRFIARNLDRALRARREYRTGWFSAGKQAAARHVCICGKRYGNYLTSLYIFVKLLYVCNCLAQVYLLNAFLGPDYHMYGIRVIEDIVGGKNWEASHLFPRVTMCDFDIRVLGNHKQTHTVQCVLPINLFNNKIYVFIWFWLVCVFFVTVVNLGLWVWTLFSRNRARYVKKYMKIMHCNFGRTDDAPSKKFCENYLRQDGIFILRLIAKNANDIAVGEILQELWANYKRHREKQKLQQCPDA